MKPTKSILDPSFKYTNAAQTDIAKTFARVRREMRAQSGAAEPTAPVLMLPLVRTPRVKA